MTEILWPLDLEDDKRARFLVNNKTFRAKMPLHQCDQMVRLHIQYLAIYTNEHLVQYHKNGQSRFVILPNMKETLQNCPRF